MAPRKDMMRIIRRDAGFSATLGFGAEGESKATETCDVAPGRREGPDAGQDMGRSDERPSTAQPREEEEGQASESDQSDSPPAPEPSTETSAARADGSAGSSRGTVVYVAVSLSARQSTLAEAWAQAARCSVPFLIRHVAQGLRDGICGDWTGGGMPEVEERRGSRGKYPTSVTLTLPTDCAADLAALYDPLGIVGLGRALGPAFRARFDAAFESALAEVGIGSGTKGREE